jgi:hypothetical protein
MKKEHKGNTYQIEDLGNGRWSVCNVTNLSDEEKYYDVEGPSEGTVSMWIGKSVRFADRGDHPDYPEAIYREDE